MVAAKINYKELKRHYEADRGSCLRFLREGLEDRTFRPDHFSLRGLFEALVPDGREYLDHLDPRRKGGVGLMEAATDAVNSLDFINLTGQIIYSRIKESYENPEFLWPQLVDQQQTPFPYGERIPGIGRVGDKMGTVGEGEGYPRAGLNEEYIDIPPTVKRGLIVDVTREAIVFDRTALVLKQAADLGYSFGVQMEKRAIDAVIGATNTYKRNGVALNTYLTSGSYINQAVSPLVDWTSVQTVLLLFDALTDPNTGEPIVLTDGIQMLVPSALSMTAYRIANATEVGTVDNQAAASTVRTFGPNPLSKGLYGRGITAILSSPYVKARSGSATTYWVGNFKKAFCRFYNWDMEITEAADNNTVKFERDIWARFKCSVRDVVAAIEPRYVSKVTAA